MVLPREDHEIRFEQEETAPIRRPVEGLISREAEPSPVQSRTLALRDDLFEADALVFDQLEKSLCRVRRAVAALRSASTFRICRI